MSDSVEKTTDCPVFRHEGESRCDDSADGSSESCWDDAGLPVELQRGMELLRVNGDLTDVVLTVRGQDFSCHRAVLAAASHYFRAMFCSGLRESHEERVDIKGVDSETMQTLLRYTYTSRAVFTHANVQRILEAASQFQFLRVVDACAAFLSRSLCLESCVEILQLSVDHNLPPLKTKVQDYICAQFSQVVQQQDFLDLPAESLESILKRNDLDVKSEERVFEAVMHWIRARQDERCPALARLLSCVRLPLVDPAYFVDHVESDELIRHCDETFPLLQEARTYHLSGREVVSERTKPRIKHFLSEVFLIIGGCTKDERFVPTVTCLDPLRRSRLEVALLPLTETEDQSKNRKWVEFACITFRNEVFISGGKETQRDVWKYNGALDKWIQIEPLTTGRWRHKMAVLGGKVYALGGFDGVKRLDSVEAYDSFHNRWTEVVPLAEGVSSCAAATFDRWIFVIGGGPNGKLATDKVQCWAVGSDCWELRAPIPIETKCTNAVSFKNHIYIVGHYKAGDHSESRNPPSVETLSSGSAQSTSSSKKFELLHLEKISSPTTQRGAMHAMYCYTPQTDSWSLVTRLGERASCAIAACSNKLFITGGRDNKNQVISTVMCWDSDREQLTEECVLPMGVSHHGSVTLLKSYTHIHRVTPASQ